MVDGFDERFALPSREDSDLYFTLIERHASVTFAPQAMVEHPGAPAPFGRSLSLQKKNYYEALLYKKHPNLYRRCAGLPIIKHFYLMALLFAAGLAAWVLRWPYFSALSLAAWGILTLSFMAWRLKNAPLTWNSCWDIFLTSMAVPFIAVYWHLLGYLKFWKV
jgi:hypothetical protein